MLKLRLQRHGRKKQPIYRLVVMENSARQKGRAVDQVGYYNPITKEFYFDTSKIVDWLKEGVKPTETVVTMLKKAKVLTA